MSHTFFCVRNLELMVWVRISHKAAVIWRATGPTSKTVHVIVSRPQFFAGCLSHGILDKLSECPPYMTVGFSPRERDRAWGAHKNRSHGVFYNLILKVIYYHFFHILLVSQSNSVQCGRGLQRCEYQEAGSLGTILEALVTIVLLIFFYSIYPNLGFSCLFVDGWWKTP